MKIAIKLALLLTLTAGMAFAQNGGNGNPCHAPNAQIYGVNGTTAAASTVQIVAANGGSSIYICSLNETSLNTVSGATFSLVFGSGSNCGSGTTTIYGPVSIATPNLNNSVPGPLGILPAGKALCYTTSGAAATNNYAVTFAQQ